MKTKVPSAKALRTFASRWNFETWSRLCSDAEFERLAMNGLFEQAIMRSHEIL